MSRSCCRSGAAGVKDLQPFSPPSARRGPEREPTSSPSDAIWCAPRSARGRYDERLCFTAVHDEGVPDTVVSRMRAFLANRDSMALAIAGLVHDGVAVRAGQGPPPQPQQQELARLAIGHLMEQACGRMNFWWGTPVRTGAVDGCEPFARELLVFEVQGHRIADDSAALYDAVAAACADRGGVALQAEDGHALATVSCHRALATRPVWYELPGDEPGRGP